MSGERRVAIVAERVADAALYALESVLWSRVGEGTER